MLYVYALKSRISILYTKYYTVRNKKSLFQMAH